MRDTEITEDIKTPLTNTQSTQFTQLIPLTCQH